MKGIKNMKCCVCNKEIEKSASKDRIICEECDAEIKKRLTEKEDKLNSILGQMHEEEKKQEENKVKIIKRNPVADSISNVSYFVLVVNLIFSILLIVAGVLVISEGGNYIFLLIGIISLVYSFIINTLLNGYAEIIKLLNRISQK
jgi:hypothetical protein